MPAGNDAGEPRIVMLLSYGTARRHMGAARASGAGQAAGRRAAYAVACGQVNGAIGLKIRSGLKTLAVVS
jgi:hypothetical protein